ncbi:MAG: 50S ribosomal protein L11 methyltransferase [Clostridia bacterium]|nr:50S ribosomal protein L11 methyltransferase [Clostridia bacterium]
MNWTEILVTVDTKDTDLCAAICNMAAIGGIYIEDYSDLEQGAWDIAHIDLIDQELIDKDRTKSIVHIYVSEENNFSEAKQFITERLSAERISYDITVNGIKDSDWAENWKKFFKVTPIGERLVICPLWEEYENTENKTVLKIDPGAAFGTGTHATTYLCLQLLDKYVSNGVSVLDIGCGSGILGVASVLLGAKMADGVDIDLTAVKVAKENAVINNVQSKTRFIDGDLAEKIDGKYDIICANIVADIIMRLNSNIEDYMKEDALYITSGIIDIRADEVKESFKNHGLTIVEELKKDNWYAFALKRR